jgi:hypothetical protein
MISNYHQVIFLNPGGGKLKLSVKKIRREALSSKSSMSDP